MRGKKWDNLLALIHEQKGIISSSNNFPFSSNTAHFPSLEITLLEATKSFRGDLAGIFLALDSLLFI